MKKSYIVIIVVLLIIVGAAIFINNAKNADTNATESFLASGNGVSIMVPHDWVKAETSSNASLLAVADSKSKNSAGYNDVNVNIEQKQTSNSLDAEFNSYCNSLAHKTNYEILVTGNVTNVGGEDGMEVDYTSTDTGIIKQHKSIWIKKDGTIYVILCSAPKSSFDQQESLFNTIIGSFKFGAFSSSDNHLDSNSDNNSAVNSPSSTNSANSDDDDVIVIK